MGLFYINCMDGYVYLSFLLPIWVELYIIMEGWAISIDGEGQLLIDIYITGVYLYSRLPHLWVRFVAVSAIT